MIGIDELLKHGYAPYNKGRWLRLRAEDLKDWEQFCADFELDPGASSVILAVCGGKEEYES